MHLRMIGMACFLHQLSFILYIFHILYLFFSLLSFLFFKKNNPTLSPPPPARQHLFNVAILWSPAAFDVFSCVWGCNSTTDAVGSGSARARESLQSLLPPLSRPFRVCTEMHGTVWCPACCKEGIDAECSHLRG